MDDEPVITMNDRGQLTIPKAAREVMGAKLFICKLEGDSIVLKPLQTRDEFLEECDAAMKDYKKHGGYTVEKMKKRHKV